MSSRTTTTDGLTALYDSVTGFAFGPTFETNVLAEDFLEWLMDKASGHHTFPMGDDNIYFLTDPRVYRMNELMEVHRLWKEDRGNDAH